MRSWMDQDCWNDCLKKDLLEGVGILICCSVITLKEIRTENLFLKGNFVVQVHYEKIKAQTRHNSTNLRAISIKLFELVTIWYKFNIWRHDNSQAYIQFTEILFNTFHLHHAQGYTYRSKTTSVDHLLSMPTGNKLIFQLNHDFSLQ